MLEVGCQEAVSPVYEELGLLEQEESEDQWQAMKRELRAVTDAFADARDLRCFVCSLEVVKKSNQYPRVREHWNYRGEE